MAARDFATDYKMASALYTHEEMAAHLAQHAQNAQEGICAEWPRRNYDSQIGAWARKTIRKNIETIRTARDMQVWLVVQAA